MPAREGAPLPAQACGKTEETMDKLRKLNTSRTVIIAILAAIFLLLLYCNYLTPLQGDDYAYMHSFADGSRITSVADILTSLRAHRLTTNGRLIPHFFVHLFLMIPLPFFKVLNAAVFTLMILLFYLFAYRFSTKEPRHNALLLCVIFGVVWVISPEFGANNLWLAGSFNYLWGETLFLLWLGIMTRDYFFDTDMKPGQELAFVLFAFVVGNYSENLSVAAVFLMLAFIVLSRFWKKRPWKRWHICGLCAMVIGFLLLAFAPAELVTKIARRTFGDYFQMFLIVLRAYLRYWPLILFYVGACWAAVRKKISLELRVLTLVFVLASMAQHFVLVAATYLDFRVTYLTCCLLLLADLLLFQALFEGKGARVLCALSAVMLALTLYWVVVGVRDLRLVHYKVKYNEELIREQLAEGKTVLHLPFILPETEYSSLYLWGYIRQDPENYHNAVLAEYYGVDKVTGYFLYETNDP